MSRLFIRTSADTSKVGFGHAMRCIALAERWDGSVTFIMPKAPELIAGEISKRGFDLITADYPLSEMYLDGDCVVFDGSEFTNKEYARGFLEDTAGKSVVTVGIVDDAMHFSPEEKYYDIILNHNTYASSPMYRNPPEGTTLLLGSRYMLIRNDFIKRRAARLLGCQTRVLTCYGGTTLGDTLKRDVTKILSEKNPGVFQIIDASASPTNLPMLMQSSGIIACSAGMVANEAAFMGLPSVLTPICDNQRKNAYTIEIAGAGIVKLNARDIADTIVAISLSEKARRRMSIPGRKITDGRGAERVCSIIEHLRERKTMEESCH